MERIDSPSSYEALVNEVRSRSKRCISNALLTNDMLEEMIKEGLFYLRTENGLLLFHEKGINYVLYFFLVELQPFSLPCLDKPVLTHQVFSEGRENTALTQLLLDCGFEEYGRFGYMRTTAVEVPQESVLTDRVTFARHGQEQALYDLWMGSMQIHTADIPSVEAIEQMIDKHQILVVNDGKRVASAIGAITGSNHIYLYLMATDPSFRRRGYCRALFEYVAHTLAQDGGTVLDLWVNTANTRAYEGYIKCGFTFTKRKSVYFINK